MLCPVCEDEMVIVEFDKVELDLCLTCSGLWFDAEELDLLGDDEVDGLEQELAGYPGRGKGSRRCPRCTKHLHMVDVPGRTAAVEIDRCPDGDGIWLDRGELPDLLSGSLDDGHPALERVVEFLGQFAAPLERED